jgi:hypothetical protein
MKHIDDAYGRSRTRLRAKLDGVDPALRKPPEKYPKRDPRGYESTREIIILDSAEARVRSKPWRSPDERA